MNYATKGVKARPINDGEEEKYTKEGWEIESDYADSEHCAQSKILNPSANVEDDEE